MVKKIVPFSEIFVAILADEKLRPATWFWGEVFNKQEPFQGLKFKFWTKNWEINILPKFDDNGNVVWKAELLSNRGSEFLFPGFAQFRNLIDLRLPFLRFFPQDFNWRFLFDLSHLIAGCLSKRLRGQRDLITRDDGSLLGLDILYCRLEQDWVLTRSWLQV